jgi:dGTPase
MIKRLQIRERTESRESALSPFAQKSFASRGRQKMEEPDPIRTSFQRDRDRIIHTKAFRRLKHKTQVFIAPPGDHFVTRLTHTLEVSQIARTIARALNLNEDLTEAISLGHDLGHTPFGHTGEDVLNDLYHGGFRHNEQSLRVVDILENEGRGLNLTWEVRDGILNHSKSEKTMFGKDWGECHTYEAEIVKISDAIAYINHDIIDAIRAGILSEKDLPQKASASLGHSHSERINSMVCDIIENSWEVSGDIPVSVTPVIKMSPQVAQVTEDLRHFMFEKVYNILSDNVETERARNVIRGLYRHFVNFPDKLPVEYLKYSDEPERRAVDFIAGMTDQYALRLADELEL